MKIGVLAITAGGIALAKQISSLITGTTYLQRKPGEKTADIFAENWHNFDGFICVMAAGIVVRSITPLVKDKQKDPAVLVIDENGQFVISLLSGHIGGGNELTRLLAHKLQATPVITTSSDCLGLAALDLWAIAQNLNPPPRDELTAVSARLVNSHQVSLYSEVTVQSLPKGIIEVQAPQDADIIVSHYKTINESAALFSPRNLVIGVGCNRGTPVSEFESALQDLCEDLSLSRSSIRNLASVDKKNDEVGLLQFAKTNNWTIDFFDSETINTQKNLEISFAALKAIGAIGVAEPSALLSANSNLLLSRKRKWKNVTMAVAQAPFTLSERDPVLSNI